MQRYKSFQFIICNMELNRRSFLTSAGVIAMGGLAGCSTVQEDINLTSEPVGLSQAQSDTLQLQLNEYITDTQTQELANPEGSEPVMLEFNLNILIYNSTVKNEQANLAFISTGSHEVVGQEVNPVSQVTPRQILQNVSSIENEAQIEKIGTETVSHPKYGELSLSKYRTTITRFSQEIDLINYGFTDKFDGTLILGIGSHLESNSERKDSIIEGLSSFKIPTEAVEGMEPKDLSESPISSVTDLEDLDIEDLPIEI